MLHFLLGSVVIGLVFSYWSECTCARDSLIIRRYEGQWLSFSHYSLDVIEFYS